jgi:hypothetical protein
MRVIGIRYSMRNGLVGTLCFLAGLMVAVKACFWYRKRNARHESSAVVFSRGVAEIVKTDKETDTGLLKETDESDRTNELRIDIPVRNFSSPRSNLD